MDAIETVKAILSEKVDVSNLKEEDSLQCLGLDSLDLVEVMLAIEDKLSTCCQTHFRNNDFDDYKGAVMDIYKEYLKKGAKPKPLPKLAHICMIARKAEIGQNKIARELFDFIKNYNKIKNMALGFEK